eukprot:SAG22_NODE_7177_length_767_cov_0.932635_3_plen_91_part_00
MLSFDLCVLLSVSRDTLLTRKYRPPDFHAHPSFPGLVGLPEPSTEDGTAAYERMPAAAATSGGAGADGGGGAAITRSTPASETARRSRGT